MAGHGLQDMDCWIRIAGHGRRHGSQDMDTDMDMDMDTEMDTDMDTDMQRREGKFDLHNIKLQKAFANILERTCEYCSVRKLFMCGGAPSAIQKA